MAFLPGEVYFAELGGAEPRRVIIVCPEHLNRGRDVLIVPLTSTRFELRSQLPHCLPFLAGEFGCMDCVAQGEQITRIPAEMVDVDHGPIDVLDEEGFRSLIRAVGVAIGADCEPE